MCVCPDGSAAVLVISNGKDFEAMLQRMKLSPSFAKVNLGSHASWGNLILKPVLQDLEKMKDLFESYGRRVEVSTSTE